MINLTTHIAVPNINRWACVAFDLGRGTATLRFFFGAGQTRFVDVPCFLSDTIRASAGARINPSPMAADDTIVPWSVGPTGAGVGLANALTNARGAYRSGANHNAGLRAVEMQGVTDGWIDPALAGT